MRVAAYWLMKPNGSLETVLAQVDRAAELAKQYNSKLTPDRRLVGVKVICDGTIDACTASITVLEWGEEKPESLWPEHHLHSLVASARTRPASPVHSDPALLRAWPRLVGEARRERAFVCLSRVC